MESLDDEVVAAKGIGARTLIGLMRTSSPEDRRRDKDDEEGNRVDGMDG